MYKVYLVYAETEGVGQWKIGVTKNMEDRLMNLRVANPNIWGVKSEYEVSDRAMAYSIESLLKKRFKHDSVGGEWIRYEALTPDIFQDQCRVFESNSRLLREYKDNERFIKKLR